MRLHFFGHSEIPWKSAGFLAAEECGLGAFTSQDSAESSAMTCFTEVRETMQDQGELK